MRIANLFHLDLRLKRTKVHQVWAGMGQLSVCHNDSKTKVRGSKIPSKLWTFEAV